MAWKRSPGGQDQTQHGTLYYGDNLEILRGAHLCMMAIRLVELRRVLKPKGSPYLHCDPTASHYLKVLLDALFGPACFRNEVVWHYGSPA